MRKIYIIGTVHNIIPKYQEELKSVLENINPNQILVEIVQKDLEKRNFKKYPKEMVYAYRWGIRNKKKVNGFDGPINIVKSIIKKNLKEIEKQVFKIINKHNWKDWNKSKYDKDTEISKVMNKIIDQHKHKLRQKRMLNNILKMMVKDGKILILTGSYHLRFFEKNLKEAIFPLRN